MSNVHVGHFVERGVFRDKRRQNYVGNAVFYKGDSQITYMYPRKERNAS